MPTTFLVKCLKCKKEFTYQKSQNFNEIIVRCLDCGKEQITDLKTLSEKKELICKCGKKMSTHGKIKCPNCGSKKYESV